MNRAQLPEPEQQVDIVRSRLYHLLSVAFSFPTERTVAAGRELRDLAETLYPEPEWDALDGSAAREELEAEYINVFDGVDQSRYCKPYEGLWNESDRARRQWEVKKFYSFFGLTLDRRLNEMPDHILYQLEFMHYLSYHMVRAAGTTAHPGGTVNGVENFRQAQQDFLERHLCQWLPAFCERLQASSALPFYRQLAQLTSRFVADDLEWIRSQG
ncbi:MAG TPA: hypothetical protein ENK05_08345 [Gammaproteobacteria bacterium]|nr:hypothetical protein [Gammaproteobacteria bacterium]